MAEGFSLTDYIEKTDVNKLDINKAKEMCDAYLKEVDPDKKKALRDELIIGMQHAIHSNLHWKDIQEVLGSSYDYEDLISIANLYVLDLIETGKLLNYTHYTNIFDSKFYTYLKGAVKEQESTDRRTMLTNEEVLSVLVDLLKINETRELTNEDYIEVIEKYMDQKTAKQALNLDYEILKDTIELLNGVDISKTRLNNVLSLVIDTAANDHRVSQFTPVNDEAEAVVTDVWGEGFVNSMLEVITDEELEVVRMFAENSDRKLSKKMKKEGKSFDNARKEYFKILRKLHDSKEFRETAVRSR